MNAKSKILLLSATLLLILTAGLSGFSPDTADGAAIGQRWAWNGIIGWIDYGGTLNAGQLSGGLTGYASSSVGYISLDCATSPAGNICGSSNYRVAGDYSGNFSGWAWNDIVGWISFCGGNETIFCPGSVDYSVRMNPKTGVFTGWAWNDVIGWIQIVGI